jgi:hypothetical protein
VAGIVDGAGELLTVVIGAVRISLDVTPARPGH